MAMTWTISFTVILVMIESMAGMVRIRCLAALITTSSLVVTALISSTVEVRMIFYMAGMIRISSRAEPEAIQ